MRAGAPRRISPAHSSLLLGFGHVRAAGDGVVLEANAQLVLLKDPQPLQLLGDDLQGVELVPCAPVRPSLLVVVSRLYANFRTGANFALTAFSEVRALPLCSCAHTALSHGTLSQTEVGFHR
jgi:hypothetical protein